MKMHNPPHPGEIIKGLWLNPAKISITDAAKALAVSRKTLSKIINGKGRLTPEMAVRLSIALGASPESWMGHQVTYDLWHIEQYKPELGVHTLNLT
jgi:addiction module HigA family antidote